MVDFNTHVLNVHDLVPFIAFACEYCLKTFRNQKLRDRHAKKVHQPVSREVGQEGGQEVGHVVNDYEVGQEVNDYEVGHEVSREVGHGVGHEVGHEVNDYEVGQEVGHGVGHEVIMGSMIMRSVRNTGGPQRF